MPNATGFICKNIGASGTTPCHVQPTDDGKFEARMGFALMGMTQMDDAGFEACAYNPFHDKFYDNYARGIGDTAEEAVEAMKKDLSGIAESLWA